MTSPDIASSIDDPSPTIPELVTNALGLQLEGRYDFHTPETALDTFQSISGAIILKRLLPQLPNESIYLLRDTITLQGETVETPSGSIDVKPASLFSGWFNKFRRPREVAVEDLPVNPLERIEITSSIIGSTEQTHLKSYPERHALVVRKSSLTGSFTLDDQQFDFDPTATVLEVGRMTYDANDIRGRISPKGRRFYTLLPSTDEVYRSKKFGGTIDDTAIKNPQLKNRTLEDMTKVLDEIQASNHVMHW